MAKSNGPKTRRTGATDMVVPQEQLDKNKAPSLQSKGPLRQEHKGSAAGSAGATHVGIALPSFESSVIPAISRAWKDKTISNWDVSPPPSGANAGAPPAGPKGPQRARRARTRARRAREGERSETVVVEATD